MAQSNDARPSNAAVALAVVAGSIVVGGLGAFVYRQFRRQRTARLVADAIEAVRTEHNDPPAHPVARPEHPVVDRSTGQSPNAAAEPHEQPEAPAVGGTPLPADDFLELLDASDTEPPLNAADIPDNPADTPDAAATANFNGNADDIRDSVDSPKPDGIFYGWFIVAAVFFILVVTSGIGFYNASVILAAATKELEASVGSVSGATGMFFAVGGLTGFVFSKRLDAADIRWFFVAGGLIGAGALFSLRWVTSVAALYAFFAVFGIGFGTAGLVPATTLITRWFDRRRSVALSIASTGLSVGGIALIPVSAWLIDTRSLAGASPWLSLIWICGIIPIAVLVLRSNPSDLGLRPDGDQRDHTAAADAPEAIGLGFTAARSTRFFIALCAAYALIYIGQVGAIAQLFNLVLERTDNATAATCLSALALTSVVARLIGGALVLRLPTRGFTAILAVLQALALVSLAMADSRAGLIMSSVFFGASVGNLLMLQPLVLAEAFGVAGYARIYSFNQLFGTIGVAGGPPLLGLIRDASDYEVAMMVAGGASFLGFVFITLAGSIGAVQALWRPAS